MHFYEIFDGAVIGSFELRCEKTCRQLPMLSVVVEALTAVIFPSTRFVGAGAILLVCFHDAFHGSTSSQLIFAVY
jgi:hypothetical protein